MEICLHDEFTVNRTAAIIVGSCAFVLFSALFTLYLPSSNQTYHGHLGTGGRGYMPLSFVGSFLIPSGLGAAIYMLTPKKALCPKCGQKWNVRN